MAVDYDTLYIVRVLALHFAVLIAALALMRSITPELRARGRLMFALVGLSCSLLVAELFVEGVLA